LSALFFLCSAPLARAYTDIGLKYSAGPDAYAGFSAFAEWGDDDYYLRPSVNSYASDLHERKSAYFFGGGLDREAWSAGAELSITPETDGYSNTSLYGDFTWNLLRAPEEGAALQDATLGVFAAYTAHEDAYSLSTSTVLGGGRKAASSTRTDVFELGQTDYGLAASVKLYGLRASGRITKTSYDADISEDSRQLPVDIGGIGTSGFPDTAVSARLKAPGLPLSPEAGYSKTTYLLDQPDAESFSLGLSVSAGPGRISAGWENFNPGGGLSRSDYYSLGVAISF
jgi:hypothetical protein